MRIACLAWGSLFWDPRTLPHIPPFRDDGFPLPIEFSRVSLDGRVTLVIDPGAEKLRTLWVLMSVDTLEDAIEGLGEREKIKPERYPEWVGRHLRGDAPPASGLFAGIDDWLAEHDLDAVVWTALPGRDPEGRFGFVPFDRLRAHLESLTGEARARAEEYIRRTPEGVRTKNRARFEEIFGWTSTG